MFKILSYQTPYSFTNFILLTFFNRNPKYQAKLNNIVPMHIPNPTPIRILFRFELSEESLLII